MTFGCCTGSFATDSFGVGHQEIAMLKRVGFDYVELPLAQMMAMDDQTFRNGPLAAREKADLPCLACNNFFSAAYRLTGPQADLDSALAYAASAFKRAAALGARHVIFGSSGARNMPLNFTAPEAYAQLTTLLRRLGDLAAPHGITVEIEHLNIQESNLITRFSQGLALARRVNHPQVGVLVDYFHLRLAQESVQDVLDGAARLGHVHLARPLGRSLPLPGDGEDYDAFATALQQSGYDGGISLEARPLPQQNEQTLCESLQYMRRCFHG